MGFQKSVASMPAIGLPGTEVNPGQATYTAFNYLSDGTVFAGGFAFAKDVEKNGPVGFNAASATGKAGARVLGFVERNLISTLPNPLVEASNTYQAGLGLNIAVRGQFYAVAAGAATEGQAVLCDPATGEVTYGDAGAATDTGWKVRMPQGVIDAVEGDIVIYENFGVSIAASAASGAAVVGEAEVGSAEVGA